MLNRILRISLGLSIALCTGPALAVDEPLSNLEVPLPKKLGKFVTDFEAAKRLGKALFWDVQVGSNGEMSCATCHNVAGADHRTRNQLAPGADGKFDVGGMGGVLTASDYPFHPMDDITGTGGVVMHQFMNINMGDMHDTGVLMDHPIFGFGRQVTGRNAPTTINAIFNEISFWDGRAVERWNGVTVGHDRSRIFVVDKKKGKVVARRVSIRPASAASQAVGPPLSDVEMSWAGRPFKLLGRKMMSLMPLAEQEVSPTDSLLGELANPDGKGLMTGVTYKTMIQDAFKQKYWDPDFDVEVEGETYALLEANFTLFWGLAILAYEATLVSDDTPFDRWLERRGTLTASERRGLDVFAGQGRCDHCHGGATFTGAAKDGKGKAFANIGVRPTHEDPGRSKGEFKTPTLRNVELTGPYFHTGGYASLRSVVDFYNRGGDFDNEEKNRQIRDLRLSERQKNDLVAFLLTLTDDRVRFEKAPFDHPELMMPDGDTLPAVGRDGGTEVFPFLGVDHFTP